MMASRKARSPASNSVRRLQSWWIPLATILLCVIGVVAIHAGWLAFSQRPAFDFLMLLAVMEIVVGGWLLLLSPLQPNRRLLAVTIFVASQAAIHQMVRLEGFAGDGRPIWTWRWIPAPQERVDWRQHHQQQIASITQLPAVDLTHTSNEDYPGFRGPNRTGHATSPSLASDWQAKPPRLLWRQPIGAGWSSFAMVGDYCVTQEQRGEHEATVCYELRTGREFWAHLERARFAEPTSGEGPRATPTIHHGRVYSLGATGALNSLDGATGRPNWTVDILKDQPKSQRLFGVAGSPLVAGSMVIVNPGSAGSSLAAYDLDTGSPVWQAGNSGASYSSPQAATLCGSAQILDFNAEGLFAHDVAGGAVLWNIPWISNPQERNNVCQPVVCPEISPGVDGVFLSSGYGMGSAMLEVRRKAGKYEVTERWRNKHLKAKFSSVIVHEGHVYGLDNSILTCLDLATGQRRWKGGHFGYGQILLAGSLLFVQLESGEVALVEASPIAFRERARFAALSHRTWNHPALAGRYLLVRNDREAACYELATNP